MKRGAVQQTEEQSPKEPSPINHRAEALRQLLGVAKLIRKRGTPEEAQEAAEWEIQMARRLQEIEATAMAQPA